MSTPVIQYVGNRNPALTDTITSGGVAQNINGKTLTFKMRGVSSTTLKVNATATNLDTDATTRGQWSYSWAAADVDTAGFYLGWVEVAGGGFTQDVPEFLIEVRAHAPGSHVYVELEQAKSALSITGFNHADAEIQRALASASRAVDDICGRRFYADTDATSVRYFTAMDSWSVAIDDLVTLTTLQTDASGDGTYENTWTTSDYSLEPVNAPTDGYPYTEICRKIFGSLYLPVGIQNGVKVTGKFGWSAVPSQVESATLMLTGRYMKRVREAPFGVVGVDSMIRLARNDPDVLSLLSKLMRNPGGRPIW